MIDQIDEEWPGAFALAREPSAASGAALDRRSDRLTHALRPARSRPSPAARPRATHAHVEPRQPDPYLIGAAPHLDVEPAEAAQPIRGHVLAELRRVVEALGVSPHVQADRAARLSRRGISSLTTHSAARAICATSSADRASRPIPPRPSTAGRAMQAADRCACRLTSLRPRAVLTVLLRNDAGVTATDATRLAVLIDSDNTTASLTTELLEEIAKYGTPTVKRAYGDWTLSTSSAGRTSCTVIRSSRCSSSRTRAARTPPTPR